VAVPEDMPVADEVRRAENETIFRETNESIRDVVAGAPAVLPVVPFICECSDAGCRELVPMTLSDYARARETPRRFLVAPPHLDRTGNESQVVYTAERFLIIEKGGLAGEVAESHDDTGRGDG
jgi:hypothetical protein